MWKKETLALTAALAVFLALLLVGEVRAGGGRASKAKDPSPARALRAAVKQFVKQKSYRVKAEIVGGFTEREDHEVARGAVRESYEAEVYGKLMHMPKEKAFRSGKKGTAYVDGRWTYIQSNLETVRFQRLFPYPEVLLGRALASARTARWIQPRKKAAQLFERDWLQGADLEERADDRQDEKGLKKETKKKKKKSKKSKKYKKKKKKKSKKYKKKKKNATVVLKKTETKRDPDAFRFLRVDASPKEALKHFIEVENSKCFGAG